MAGVRIRAMVVLFLALLAVVLPGSATADSSALTVQQLCTLGNAYHALGHDDKARDAYQSALDKAPRLQCAKDGIAQLDDWDDNLSFSGALTGIVNWIPRAVVLVVAVLAVLFAFVAIFGRIRWVKRVLLAIPVFAPLVAPRLSFGKFDATQTGTKVDSAFTARLKASFEEYAKAAVDTDPNRYMVDVDGKKFVDVVSGDTALQNAITSARDISDQSKPAAAVLDLLYAVLPIDKYSVDGSLDKLASDEVSATLTLQDGARQVAAATLGAPIAGKEAAESDYVRLARPAAVWIHYELVSLAGKIRAGSALSYACLAAGIDRQREGDNQAAQREYEKAIAVDPANWTARVNLVGLQAPRFRGDQELAIVKDALARIRRFYGRDGDDDESAAPIEDADYFRLFYQLAAAYLTQAFEEPRVENALTAKALALFRQCADTAVEIVAEVDELLELYARRRLERVWIFGPRVKLTPEQARLERVLVTTIRPASEALAAMAKLQLGDEADAGKLIDGIRSLASRDRLNYRPYYNLACYYASRPGGPDVDQACDDLREALARAFDWERDLLLQTAKVDPSLDPLRKCDRFAALLRQFGPAPGSGKPR